MTNNIPAFPRPISHDDPREARAEAFPEQEGMSLRDWFAGQAIQGLIASNDAEAGDRVEELPAYAYSIADAMLAERKKWEA